MLTRPLVVHTCMVCIYYGFEINNCGAYKTSGCTYVYGIYYGFEINNCGAYKTSGCPYRIDFIYGVWYGDVRLINDIYIFMVIVRM